MKRKVAAIEVLLASGAISRLTADNITTVNDTAKVNQSISFDSLVKIMGQQTPWGCAMAMQQSMVRSMRDTAVWAAEAFLCYYFSAACLTICSSACSIVAESSEESSEGTIFAFATNDDEQGTHQSGAAAFVQFIPTFISHCQGCVDNLYSALGDSLLRIDQSLGLLSDQH